MPSNIYGAVTIFVWIIICSVIIKLCLLCCRRLSTSSGGEILVTSQTQPLAFYQVSILPTIPEIDQPSSDQVMNNES